ncbi:capsule biosynthesis protein [Pseudomonas sp. zbq_18]|uniref:capsule biosynthesis protein n=1 Tax=Pseudomonadota TaxID=1224 RepID=UPI00370BB17D
MSTNPWLTRARALDRYRWLLLRERYGLLGSGLRFLREACEDWWLGVRARRRLSDANSVQACDFLLLQSMPKVIPLQRKKLLKDALVSGGFNLVEIALQDSSLILRERMLKLPPHPVPTRYFAFAAHAEWLVEHYRPCILLNDRNGSLFAPFLRLALNARQGLLVHLAHATTVEGSRRLGMNDYDYYFLFGQSSLEALQARELRFGSSQAVLAGSHMIDQTYDLLPAESARRVLLILGVGPDKEKQSGYQATYALLRDWAVQHPEYQVLVKPHPRSRVLFWQETAPLLDNLRVLPRECGLAEALQAASVVVNIMSNAVIEAALARRPVIYVNASGERDIFSQERFFGPCITSVDALQARIASVEREYEVALQQGHAFAEYHLTHGCAGLARNLEALTALLDRKALPVHSQMLESTVE